MTLNASGNLGLGVTPNTWSLGKVVEINSGGNALWSAGPADTRLTAGAYYNGAYKYGNTGSGAASFEIGNGAYFWRTAPSGTINNNITFTQAMTLDASGLFFLGTTAAVGGAAARATLSSPNLNASYGGIGIKNEANVNGGYFIHFVNYNNAVIGSISQNATTTVAYNTSSDYRLKENIAPMVGALDKVALLKPVTYTWKDGGEDGQGFIAHELAEVVPDCVTGEKDATREEEYEISPAIPAVLDEEGNVVTPAVEAVMGTRTVPVYQGIDTSFLVATLTAAIQELSAKVAALEAK